MRFLFYIFILFLSSFNCFAQQNYTITSLSNDDTDNGILLNSWYINLIHSNTLKVNTFNVTRDSETRSLKIQYKDSSVIASPYFDDNNAQKRVVKILSDEMISYNGRLFFQGYYHLTNWSNHCMNEANLMAWDGVNAPYFLSPAFPITSNCYTEGEEIDQSPIFNIKNFTAYNDTLFYTGSTSLDTYFYFLDKNDSSKTVLEKSNVPEGIDYVYKTVVVGNKMYLICARNNGSWGLFEYKGINTTPVDVGISFAAARSINSVNFIPVDNRLHIAINDGNANYTYKTILFDGTIIHSNVLGNTSNYIRADNYLLYKKHVSGNLKWFHLATEDLDNSSTIPVFNNMEHYNVTGNSYSHDGLTYDISTLKILGKKDDYVFLEKTHSITNQKKDQTSGNILIDTLKIDVSVLMYGPDGVFPIKRKENNCSVNYDINVQHIADCSETGDSSVSEGKLTLCLKDASNFSVSWFSSSNKKDWSLIKKETITKDTIQLKHLTKGFYKAVLKSENCIKTTPYYEVKSLKGINSSAYVKEKRETITLVNYGVLPIEAKLVTAVDTTFKNILFEVLNDKEFTLVDGVNYLYSTDQSGCTNIDTFKIGLTEKPIEAENLCDSIKFSFNTIQGVPPYTVHIHTSTGDTVFYQVYDSLFRFNKTFRIPINRPAITIVVTDKIYHAGDRENGEVSTKRINYSRPKIKLGKMTPPNCHYSGSKGGIKMEVQTYYNPSKLQYSWLDNDTLNSTSRRIKDYGDYYFLTTDTINGCVFKDTISVKNKKLFKDIDIGIKPRYETCTNYPLSLGSSDTLTYVFSNYKNSSSIIDTAEILFFTSTNKIIDSTIYYAPYNKEYGCIGKFDSTHVVSVQLDPINPSDTVFCEIGDTILLNSKYAGTMWFFDDFLSSNFDGKDTSFSFKTTDSIHTIYTLFKSDSMFCSIPFDTIKVKYIELEPLSIFNSTINDSIVDCDTVMLYTNKRNSGPEVYWVKESDTLQINDSILQIIPPFKGEVRAFQLQGRCKSSFSNTLYVENYTSLNNPVVQISNDSIFASVAVNNDDLSYEWYFNNELFQKDRPFIIPDKNGDYFVKAQDSKGLCIAFSDTISFTHEENELKVYPTPTTSLLKIEHPLFHSITIYTLSGEEMDTFLTSVLDLSKYSSSVYIAEIRLSNGQTYFKKIIKN